MANPAELVMTLDNDTDIVSRDVLMTLNRGALKQALSTSNSPEDLGVLETRLCSVVVRTIQSNETDSKHLVAVCDTAKILLKNLRSSTVPEVWTQIYEAASQLFERGKAKSGRVILKNLISILPPGTVGIGIQHAVLSGALDTLMAFNPLQSLVFSAVVIDQFLSTSTSLGQFLEMVSFTLTRVGHSWVAYLEQLGVGELAKNNLGTILEGSGDQSFQDARSQACISSMIATLLISAAHTESPTAIAHLLQTFMAKLKLSDVELMSCEKIDWVLILQDLLRAHPQSLDKLAIHTFPVLYKVDGASFISLVRNSSDLQEPEMLLDHRILLLLAVISYLMKVGHIGEYSGLEEMFGSAFGCDSYLGSSTGEIIRSLSQHNNPAIRIRVMSLWVASEKTRNGIPPIVFGYIEQGLPHIHNLHDSQLRNDALHLMKQVIDRTTGEFERIDRARVPQNLEAHQERDRYMVFARWYINYLFEELFPTASYQRHFFALKIILHVFEYLTQKPDLPVSGGRSFPFAEIFEMSSQSVLFDLLFDPFEDVRQLASRVLRLHISFFVTKKLDDRKILSSLEHWPQKLLDEALTMRPNQPRDPFLDNHGQNARLAVRSAFKLLQPAFWYNRISIAARLASQTNRANHADGLGRLLELYFSLLTDDSYQKRVWSDVSGGSKNVGSLGVEVIYGIVRLVKNGLSSGGTSLNVPVEDVPLHGCLYGLRYSFTYHVAAQCLRQSPDRIETLAEMVITLCERVWDAVHGRLCVDAPESEMDELEDGEILAGPKDLLSYSWRALRDSSLVLHALLSTDLFSPSAENGLSTYKMFKRIGTLCMEQMTTLRHRGAFSAVSRTFELFCRRCVESQLGASDNVLEELFETGKARMATMDEKITRRSAGFPSFMSAILIAKDRRFFNEVLRDFSHRALHSDSASLGEQKVSISEVHVLNCLREVYLTAELRDRSVSWLESGLVLASECIVSRVWAIRNCGLMLLRAVVNRLSRPRKSQNVQYATLYEQEAEIPLKYSSRISIVALQLLLPELKGELNRAKQQSSKTKGTADVHDLLASAMFKNLPSATNSDPETLCVAVNLLGRINFKIGDAPVVQSLLASLLSHRAWLVRDQTARAYAKLFNSIPQVSPTALILAACKDCHDQNEIHGRLLAARYTHFKCALQHDQDHINTANRIREMEPAFRQFSFTINNENAHPVVQAAFLDLLNDCLKSVLSQSLNDAVQPTYDSSNLAKIGRSFVQQIRRRNNFPLLGRATTLNEILLFLLRSPQSPELCESAQPLVSLPSEKITSADPDALYYAITELSDIDIKGLDGQLASMQLYFAILKSCPPEDVVALAARRLAHLIGCFAKDDQIVSQCLDFSWFYGWLNARESNSNISRDMWIATLCLRAAMLKHDCTKPNLYACSLQKCRFCKYLKLLRYAADDGIDLPTRTAGLQSLAYLEPVLADDLGSMSDNHRVRAIVVLYDLLSDDDEDIREGAASIASTIYSRAIKLKAGNRPLTSAAVGPKLLLQVALDFNDDELRQVAIERLFVPSLPQAVKAAQTRHRNVLFEEEKQNLYRDDVIESTIWAQVLINMSPPPLSKFQAIASEGLRYILKEKTLVEGSLRMNPDIIVLCARLTLTAEVLLEWRADDELAQLVENAKQMFRGKLILPNLITKGKEPYNA